MPDDADIVDETQDESSAPALESGAYEIIRNRLRQHGAELRTRMEALNQQRKETFGSIETTLVTTERVTTANNCTPRDMVAVGSHFLFGYNVQLGLRSETRLADVFAVYEYTQKQFRERPLVLFEDPQFQSDFKDLYKYYKGARFLQFAEIGPYLYMVFQAGKAVGDIKAFKWERQGEKLRYVDNRSEHEVQPPAQHEFEWIRTTRDMFRFGEHPHVSIEDRLFVETVGGDLTIKVEDNTASGEGLYAEPVDDPDQTLDDGEIHYAIVGNLILLKVKPYREEAYRYFVYSEKVQQVQRIDDIENACVLLPEDHGVIFSSGYYLQTGEYKQFGLDMPKMRFEARRAAPNGEDVLYTFYNPEAGAYVLLSYNLIEQTVQTPLVCNGYSLFENGEMLCFKAPPEPQKAHAIQIWQTAFVGADYEPEQQQENYLFKIGNRDIVRCMAGCSALLNLIHRDDTYANLYLDITKQATDLLDAYFWIGETETRNLGAPLTEIRNAARSAIDEFEKVVAMKKSAAEQLAVLREKALDTLRTLRQGRFAGIQDYVKALGAARLVRGEIISLRDMRYMDLATVDQLETEIAKQAEALAKSCVEFLLQEESLAPYATRVEEIRGQIDGLRTVAESKALDENVGACGSELEMLIEIVSNLKIEDATQRTTIIDNISAIYSTLNQVRSTLRNKIKSLASSEGVAEFGAQMKLLNQAVINFLDVCDTPEKTEEYLSKVMVQLEEMEGRFADFDDFIEELATKRDEIYNAFENRKLSLVEARNRKAAALQRSAERILKGIRTRVETLDSIAEINGYFAGDLMIEKVRDIVTDLMALGDSVKADDIASRLKSLQQDTVRQLKDKQELFLDGDNVIRFGQHQFSVNTQTLDLTVVRREDTMFLHLAGTNFFEAIADEDFNATRAAWDQDLVSEDEAVYRAEYLAYQIFTGAISPGAAPDAAALLAMPNDELKAHVQQFMGPRYAEGYVKGVHDHDAALLLRALLDLQSKAGLLRYHPSARALARLCWHHLGRQPAEREPMAIRLQSLGQLARAYDHAGVPPSLRRELHDMLNAFIEEQGVFDPTLCVDGAAYLATAEGEGKHPASPEAGALLQDFYEKTEALGTREPLAKALENLQDRPGAAFGLAREWLEAFVAKHNGAVKESTLDEAAAWLVTSDFDSTKVASVSVQTTVTGLVGGHDRIVEGACELDLNEFRLRLQRFETETVPRFHAFQQLKQARVEAAREELRLDELKPRVLTSFVRNRLIDQVYLPLIGDNLAKQIGVVGEKKRTDLMGLLLLVSPPGYGKTTLMEYIANRLGIIFMKINGPAIGHGVTSLDPEEAPNAAAREEVEKINLAFEMGDNVMIYLDDIQHCNPELLQKFISLCDAQRRIEGVYKGRTRTYDLRGKKVCVVMAGNPYTESGEAFKIPDMLANRADTYNLGDIIGGNADAFKLSYIENALTSNPVLGKLASRSQKDVVGIVRIAESGNREGVELEGNYTAQETAEFVSVMEKLLRVRDVVLRVNLEYITSAAQSDEFRTEPPFKMQGSYRNMNRLAEKVLPIMNEAELESLLRSHYENEAQTLTTGAEANLIKWRRMMGQASDADDARWAEITRTYKRNQLFRGTGGDDKMGQILTQMATFKEGLEDIQSTLGAGLEKIANSTPKPMGVSQVQAELGETTLQSLQGLLDNLARAQEQTAQALETQAAARPAVAKAEDEEEAPPKRPETVITRLDKDTLLALKAIFGKLKLQIPEGALAPATPVVSEEGVAPAAPQSIEIVNRVPRGMLHILRQQFKLIQNWLEPILKEQAQQTREMSKVKDTLDGVVLSYKNLIDQIERGNRIRDNDREIPDDF